MVFQLADDVSAVSSATLVVVGSAWYLSGFAPCREARSQPGVTVAGGRRGPIGMGGDPEPVQMILQSTITSVWGVLPPASTRSS